MGKHGRLRLRGRTWVCRRIAAGIAILGPLLAAGAAGAAPLTVANFSFESPALTQGLGASPIPHWSGNGGVFFPAVGVQVASVPHGSQVAYILGSGSIFQDLGVPVEVGRPYQLDVYVGTQINFRGGSYAVSLLAGGATVIASASGTRGQTDPFLLVTISGIGAGSGNLRVVLDSTNPDGQMLFDNVQVQALDSPVPEPSTLSLLGLGLAALARRRWSATRKAS